MSKLLIEEYPLVILPQLAAVIGLNEAIVLQQIHYWVDLFKQAKDKHHYQEGKWWVWNTGAEWQENFPFWSECTVRRILDSLRKPHKKTKRDDKKTSRGPLIIVGKFNKKGYDQTLWYRINYQEVDRIEASLAECVNGPAQVAEEDISNVSKPIPETTSETNTEKLAASAVDTSSEKPLTKSPTPVIIEIVDSEYLSEPCPWCDADIILKNLRKSAAICPHCETPLWVKNSNGVEICKPPQRYRNKRQKKVIGDLVPNCPNRLAGMVYYAKDKQTIELLVERNRDMFLECLNWAVGKMAIGEMEPNKVVIRAVAWMQKRLKADPQQQTQSTTIEDAIKGTNYTAKEMERIIAWRQTKN